MFDTIFSYKKNSYSLTDDERDVENHANVVPRSIAKQTTREITLAITAPLEEFLVNIRHFSFIKIF